jgi:hypothetical protein
MTTVPKRCFAVATTTLTLTAGFGPAADGSRRAHTSKSSGLSSAAVRATVRRWLSGDCRVLSPSEQKVCGVRIARSAIHFNRPNIDNEGDATVCITDSSGVIPKEGIWDIWLAPKHHRWQIDDVVDFSSCPERG